METVWGVSLGLAWAVVIVNGLTLIAALFALGRIHIRSGAGEAHVLITDDGPALHSPMPEFEGRDRDGKLIRRSEYAGKSLALLLLSPGCDPCVKLLAGLEATRRKLDRSPEFLMVIEGDPETAGEILAQCPVGFPVIMEEEPSIRLSLGVARTPYGFLMDEDGIVRMKGVINQTGQLEGLVTRRGQYLGEDIWESMEQHDKAMDSSIA